MLIIMVPILYRFILRSDFLILSAGFVNVHIYDFRLTVNISGQFTLQAE